MEIAKCKHCGGDQYHIQHVYSGYRQSLAVVECSECRGELIPVVFMSRALLGDLCLEAWNKANTADSIKKGDVLPGKVVGLVEFQGRIFLTTEGGVFAKGDDDIFRRLPVQEAAEDVGEWARVPRNPHVAAIDAMKEIFKDASQPWMEQLKSAYRAVVNTQPRIKS